jgi:hypothetical protein
MDGPQAEGEVKMDMGLLLVALLGVGVIQALIQVAKPWVTGGWVNVYAIFVGIALAMVALYAFPAALPNVTPLQAGLFGLFNGLSATGIYAYRRGDPNIVVVDSPENTEVP